MDSPVLVYSLVLGVLPLLFLLKPGGLAPYFQGSLQHRMLAAVGLAVAYLGARLLFIIFYNLLFFGTQDFPPDPRLSPSLGVGVDFGFWLVIRFADRYWRGEHPLYKAAVYYLIEPWILALPAAAILIRFY